MSRFIKSIKAFTFKQFSKKQKKLMNWWNPLSPVSNFFMVIADGAVRSGKTIAMIISFLTWSQTNFENETFIIAGKSINSLNRNVIKPMKEIMHAWGWKSDHNRSENYLVIGNNTYYLFGANNEASQDVLQGLTAAGALADEVALFPRSFVEQMIVRCSVEGAKIFMNCNPKGPYHYLKTEYIDKAKEKGIYRLHFTMDDNLSLSKSYRANIEKNHAGVFYQRYILGLWVMAEGIIYSMFDKAAHVLSDMGKEWPKKFDKLYIAIDYGTQNACVFLLVGRKGSKVYVIDEYYYSGRDEGEQKTDNQYLDDLNKFIGDKIIESIIVDPSAASFITLLKQNGFKVIKAKNDVEDGIRVVSSYLNKGKILISDVCKNIVKEFYSYVWDKKASERGQDIPVKKMDHAMDALRYFVYTIMYKKPKRANYSGKGAMRK